LPQPRAVVRSAAILNTKNAWVIYLVVAVFVTMIATAAITSAIFVSVVQVPLAKNVQFPQVEIFEEKNSLLDNAPN